MSSKAIDLARATHESDQLEGRYALPAAGGSKQRSWLSRMTRRLVSETKDLSLKTLKSVVESGGRGLRNGITTGIESRAEKMATSVSETAEGAMNAQWNEYAGPTFIAQISSDTEKKLEAARSKIEKAEASGASEKKIARLRSEETKLLAVMDEIDRIHTLGGENPEQATKEAKDLMVKQAVSPLGEGVAVVTGVAASNSARGAARLGQGVSWAAGRALELSGGPASFGKSWS